MPTYHYVEDQGKLIMQSQENGRKPQFEQFFFDDFKVKHLQIENFSEIQVSFKLKVIFSTNFRPKIKKFVRAVFGKNVKVSDFGLIQRPFREYLQIRIFFSLFSYAGTWELVILFVGTKLLATMFVMKTQVAGKLKNVLEFNKKLRKATQKTCML